MYLLIFTGILLFIVALLIIAAVLIQNPKDEGGSFLAENRGMNQLIGTSNLPTFLEYLTYFLMAALVVLTIILSALLSAEFGSGAEEKVLEDI